MRERSNSVWRPNEKGLLSVWQSPHTGGATFNSRGLCRRRPFWPTWRCRHRLRTNVVQFVAKKNSMDRKNKVWPCLLLDDGGPGFWKHEKMYEVDSDLLQKTRTGFRISKRDSFREVYFSFKLSVYYLHQPFTNINLPKTGFKWRSEEEIGNNLFFCKKVCFGDTFVRFFVKSKSLKST